MAVSRQPEATVCDSSITRPSLVTLHFINGTMGHTPRFIWHLKEVLFTKTGQTMVSSRFFPNKVNRYFRLIQHGNPPYPRPEITSKKGKGKGKSYNNSNNNDD